jgi:hypothetical protein
VPGKRDEGRPRSDRRLFKKTQACLESKEPTSGETESMAVYAEVPKEKAALKTVGALKKPHGDQYLDIGAAVSRRNGPRAMVGPRRSWPSPAEG